MVYSYPGLMTPAGSGYALAFYDFRAIGQTPLVWVNSYNGGMFCDHARYRIAYTFFDDGRKMQVRSICADCGMDYAEAKKQQAGPPEEQLSRSEALHHSIDRAYLSAGQLPPEED